MQGGSLLGSRVSLTICPCRLDECVALCACVCVCCHSAFPLVCVASVVGDEGRKEGRNMTNIRERSLETQDSLVRKSFFNLP